MHLSRRRHHWGCQSTLSAACGCSKTKSSTFTLTHVRQVDAHSIVASDSERRCSHRAARDAHSGFCSTASSNKTKHDLDSLEP